MRQVSAKMRGSKRSASAQVSDRKNEYQKMQGSIYAFINYRQAARFGHVGWGFQLDDHSYYFGSSDHLWKHDWYDLAAWLAYMHVPAQGDIDWWAAQGSKALMLETMKSGPHIRYHAFKELKPADTMPERAATCAGNLKTGGWNIANHNCVHQAFLILSSYSRQHGLPDPFKEPLYLIPVYWFAGIAGEPQVLQ
jgi:hypothetical protein